MKNKLILFSALGWVILMQSVIGHIEGMECIECDWEVRR